MAENENQSQVSIGGEDPLPIIVNQFMWAVRNIRERKNTNDEKGFYGIGRNLEKEIQKYIYE